MIPLLASVYAFLFGACIGSFLNVCIGRWPLELSVVHPRSRCPRCGHQLAWYENIPILSWIALRARCRSCAEPISMQYPAIELVVALGWLLAVLHFGPTFTAVRVAVYGTVLLGIAMTDAQHYLIPDGFTLFGLFWAIVTAMVAFFLGNDSPLFAGPYDALIGACAGAGMVAIVGWLGEVALKKEAMGMGDVTLMAFVGAVVGPARALVTVFLGALLGAVAFVALVHPILWLRRGRAHALHEQTELALEGAASSGEHEAEGPLVPFGVFLAPAALLTLLWGDALLAWLVRA